MGVKTNENSTLKINIIFNTFYQILILLTPLLTAPYISRVLGSEGVGVYSFTNSLVTYFTMFASLGTIAYGTRKIALNRDDKKNFSKNFFEIEILSVLTSFIMLIFWIIFSFFYSEYKITLLILSFNILAVCFDISWLYAGLEKYKYTVIINTFFKVLSVVLIFLLVKNKSDVNKYIFICSMSIFLGNISMWIFLPFTISRCKIDFKSIFGHFKETLVYFIPTIATTIYTVLDKTLIGLLIQGETTIMNDGVETIVKNSELENGYYEQATKLINIVKTVSFISINGVMTSRASYLYGKNDVIEVKKLLNLTLEFTLFLSIGSCFGLIAVSPIFVPLFFGDGFYKTINLVKILSPIVIIICISNTLGSVYYTPSGNRKKSSIYLLIGSLINLILNIPLIIFFNSIGAAIASIIAEAIISILYVINAKSLFGFKEFIRLIWKKIIAGLLLFASIYFINLFLKEMNLYFLIVLDLFVGLLIYISILLILKDSSVKFGYDLVKRKLMKGKNNI